MSQSESEMNPASFKIILSKLIKPPQQFNDEDIQLAINHLVTPGAALPEQVGAFLTGLTLARVELREDLLLAAAAFVFSRSIPVIIPDSDKHFIVDVVGTGGDGHNTFNVSTSAAIIAAGAGARVIKVYQRPTNLYTISVLTTMGHSAARQRRIDLIVRL